MGDLRERERDTVVGGVAVELGCVVVVSTSVFLVNLEIISGCVVSDCLLLSVIGVFSFAGIVEVVSCWRCGMFVRVWEE